MFASLWIAFLIVLVVLGGMAVAWTYVQDARIASGMARDAKATPYGGRVLRTAKTKKIRKG